MITWPKNLIEDLASRRAVIFFGSGVSRNSKGENDKQPESWWKFLENIKIEAKRQRKIKKDDLPSIERLMSENDLLSVCDILKSAIGREEFVKKVRQEFKEPKYKAAEIHQYIHKLDLRTVITPNFDEIYDNYASNASGGTSTVKHYKDVDLAESLRGNERLIVKIHGTVSRPNELIFTRGEYAKARNEYRSFYSLIESLLRTHTFLFLGCGLSDPDIRLLLEDYAYSFSHSRQHYFAIASDALGPVSSEVIGKSLNLEFIKYSSQDNHRELTTELGKLAELVERERAKLAEKQLW